MANKLLLCCCCCCYFPCKVNPNGKLSAPLKLDWLTARSLCSIEEKCAQVRDQFHRKSMARAYSLRLRSMKMARKMWRTKQQMMHIACIIVWIFRSFTRSPAQPISHHHLPKPMRCDAMRWSVKNVCTTHTKPFLAIFWKRKYGARARAQEWEKHTEKKMTRSEMIRASSHNANAVFFPPFYKYVFQVQLFACVIHFISLFRAGFCYFVEAKNTNTHASFEGSQCVFFSLSLSLSTQLFVYGSHK